ncbi:amino acid ABC transporter membrane protein 1, PAAT family [Desulfocicer vacuolatum DSM 3385]|uniref:Amino acid ABC transporter membrane protein 1, PAAT family n=1 Tax=Desulfocicer vacuolatum DSM 3385 TaxID=1121400 RepID=A0A1W2A1V4_9BACT|nr:ABC transporter permease subunit [Desulfocicer vacuolatum]SMC54411.1 amino acid ABC transporter membrane protein 1, PAAT family [Desulfocicer vacuolatum DSM 3385]
MVIHTYIEYMGWGAGGWGDEFFFGFLMTLKISLSAYALAVIFGFFATTAKLSKNIFLRFMAVSYTTVVRALPEILMVLIVYFTVAGLAETALVKAGFVDKGFQFNPFWAAVFALAFVAGAFMAEVLRAARLAVPEGQIESATAIGMSSLQIFMRVILPQMMRHAIPGMGNLWLSITKDSAIVAVLGAFSELLYTGYRAAAATKEYVFFYGVTAVLFLLITLISIAVIQWMERHLNRGYA